ARTLFSFFFQAEDGIRDFHVTGVQTCALPISSGAPGCCRRESHAGCFRWPCPRTRPAPRPDRRKRRAPVPDAVIRELPTARRVEVSFEFFPPQTPEMEATLWRSIERLAVLAQRVVSVTYGADGSTRERTHAAVERVLRETSLTPAPHLTCIGASRGEIDDIARGYWDMGIRHLVALRGDPPRGTGAYVPRRDGYAYAADLV